MTGSGMDAATGARAGTTRRTLSPLAACAANGLVLLGLLFGGWSVWTVLEAYCVEVVLEVPFLAYRLRRALPGLPPEELEAYLAVKDREISNGRSVGGLIRTAWARRGPGAGGREAARQFLWFWGPFVFAPAIFIFPIGLFVGGTDTFLAGVGPLLIVGGGVVAGELVSIWSERSRRPALPSFRAFELRFVVVSLAAILIVWAMALFGPNVTLIGVLFVAIKTVVDLRADYFVPARPWEAR